MYRSLFNNFFVFLLLYVVFAGAQVNFLPVSGDYTYFKNDSTTAYVEFYISFYQGNLQYRQEHDTLYAKYRTGLLITQNGDTVQNSSHLYKNLVQDTSKLNLFNQFNDVFHSVLKPGTYTVRLRLEDMLAQRSGEYELTAFIPVIGHSLTLSGIQLAGSIQKSSDKKGLFYKNGIQVIPNAHNKFDVLHPMLYYYVELYNLDKYATYDVNYYVTNDKGDTVKQGKPRTRKIINTDQVEIGGFNALGLPAGVYTLSIAVNAGNGTDNTRVKKRFAVAKFHRKKEGTAAVLPDMDEAFTGMSRDELKQEFEAARYFASRDDKKLFDELEDSNAMRMFLTRFWRRMDKNNGRPYGSSRASFLKRRDKADARFSRSGQQGWKTDRGRVLIVYGEPDEIERHPSSSGTKPYEIWRYNQIQGGVYFVFVDNNGFGRYYLIHSTHRKELQNPYWENEVGIRDNGFYR